MTFFMHSGSGVFGDGGFWSINIQTSGAISEAAAETAWGNALTAFFNDTNVKTYYSTGHTFNATSTSTASPSFRQTTKTSTAHNVVGTSAGHQLPTVLAPVISFYTAQATKSGRGRIFLPSPSYSVLQTTTEKGQLSSTVAANIATAWRTLITSMTTAGLNQILYTREKTRGGTPQYTTTQVSAWHLQTKLHVQKRRSDKILAGFTTI